MMKKRTAKIHNTASCTKLRKLITGGKFPPGAILPKRDELQKILNVSNVTVQRTLNQLHKEGFLKSIRGKGTYVVDHPPHLYHFGVVLPVRHYNETRFFSLLNNIADSRDAFPEGWRFKIYMDLDASDRIEDYGLLMSDIANHKLAGLCFSFVDPKLYTENETVIKAGLPLAQHGLQSCLAPPNVSTVYSDKRHYIEKMLKYLAERGRKRIAILCAPEGHEWLREIFYGACRNCGMESRPEWVQHPWYKPNAVKASTDLLLSLAKDNRPDAIISANETYESGLSLAVEKMSTKDRESLDIISYCNFPAQNPMPFPIRRIGLDIRDILKTYAEAIIHLQEGNKAERHLLMAMFEDEKPPYAENLISEKVSPVL